jgi:hypothetical protein
MGGPIGGQLRVTAHTTGPTGAVVSYTVIVVGVTEQPVPVNGTGGVEWHTKRVHRRRRQSPDCCYANTGDRIYYVRGHLPG